MKPGLRLGPKLVLSAGFAALLGWALFSCANVPPRIGEPGSSVKDAAAESEYQSLLKRYSAHQELYGGLDTEVFAAATYQSLPFRVARARRVALFQVQPPEELERQLAKERAQFAEGPEFFVGFHTTNFHYDDLDKADSIWRIALVTANGEVTPARVERIGRADVNMRAYYPYMGDFWTAYQVQFPKELPNHAPSVPPGGDKILLRIASTLGKAEFRVNSR